MSQVLAVLLGGALGAGLRYLFYLSALFLKLSPSLGTLSANALGCFALGYLKAKGYLSPMASHFLIIGFLGALTTFSSFTWEGFVFLEKSFFLGLSYLMGSLILGLLLLGLGFWLGGGKITWI